MAVRQGGPCASQGCTRECPAENHPPPEPLGSTIDAGWQAGQWLTRSSSLGRPTRPKPLRYGGAETGRHSPNHEATRSTQADPTQFHPTKTPSGTALLRASLTPTKSKRLPSWSRRGALCPTPPDETGQSLTPPHHVAGERSWQYAQLTEQLTEQLTDR